MSNIINNDCTKALDVEMRNLRYLKNQYMDKADAVRDDMYDLAKEYNKCDPTSTNANAAAAADDGGGGDKKPNSADRLNLDPFSFGLGVKGGSSNKCIPKRIKSKAQQRRISLRRNCTRRRSRRRSGRSRHTRNLRR
jgi:hypothetical protein